MKHEINFFPKIITPAPTPINWHSMIKVCWMDTKKIQSLKGGGMHVISFLKKNDPYHALLGDWEILVAIQ
jgi:hypothetical protein